MRFKYVGPFDAVDVPDLGLSEVKHGDVVEATGAIAESFDAQSIWQRVDKPKPRRQSPAETTED